jgi:hypothetical protein
MSRSFGLPPAVTAAEQLIKHYPPGKVQPLPPGSPAQMSPGQLGVIDSNPITFFVIGDHGGVMAPGPQNAVSYALQEVTDVKPAFVYSVGDIVYFHGEASQYQPQFYEPYAHVNLPIVGIPGNHDGDVAQDDAGNPTGRQPLDTFLANFCTATPQAPPADPELEFGRHTQTLPWCDWTLALEAVTIIGLYSNVPSGGHFETTQTDWMAAELKAAPSDRPLILTFHHPPLSVDAMHGGSKKMVDAVTQACATANRYPDVILTGHVHDYQRFSWDLAGHTITTIVQGNSGYHNLHKLAADAKPGLDLGNGVTFEYGDDAGYGFLTLTVSGAKVSGTYTGVVPGTMPDGSDAKVTPGKDSF